MIFKSSSIALMVSTAIACSANASEAPKLNTGFDQGNSNKDTLIKTDTRASFAISEETHGVYIIRLTEKSALDKSYAKLGNDRTSALTKIDAQQTALIQLIKSIDSSAIVLQKVRMVDNTLHVQLTHEAASILEADALKETSLVASVLKTNAEANNTEENSYKPYPHLVVKDAGDSITVAIIGNGVDYTHAALGGTGTSEAYDQAWKNRSNAWDGFPTDTVIGGMDFAAGMEGYHIDDYNPIEDQNNASALNFDAHYPSGTAQAALILEQAPDAKILSYKTLDWSWQYFYPALDFIVDPNQDGDISDRPDIMLVNSYGSGGFYQSKGTGLSHTTFVVDHMRRLAGLGSLVVVPAGTTYWETMFNISGRGVTPEALTVGSVRIDGDDITLSSFTPAGPSRGDDVLKPDVVAPAEGMEGAIAGTGNEKGELAATAAYAAAYTAGVAARGWAAQPNLSALEVKALVTNTAVSDNILGQKGVYTQSNFEATYNNSPEVPFMGTGLVNGENAAKANAVVWETGSYQPGLAFGYMEAASNVSSTRDITIKNLTNEVQTYTVGKMVNGDKPNNAAVSFIYPEVVSIPANHSVTFPVTLTINADLLGAWPINSTVEYTMENWMAAAVNGYLTFNNQDANADDAQLKMAWQVFPKSSKPFEGSNNNISTKLPYQSDDFKEKNSQSGMWVGSNIIDLENTQSFDRTLFALPMITDLAIPDESKVTSQGHIIKAIGTSLYAEASCPSGQALSVAVEMFEKFQMPQAEHYDKAGHALTWFSIYEEAYSDKEGHDPLNVNMNAPDTAKMAVMNIVMDDFGQARTTYTDLNMEYDRWNPSARIKASTLETHVAPGGKVVVANICIDNLYHDDFQSPEVWNNNLGWQFATDRDALSNIAGPILRFNPVLGGNFWQEIIDHTGEDGYPQWWDTNCQPKSWNPDNCIESATFFLSSTAGIALLPEGEDATEIAYDSEALTWSNIMTIPAGRSARLSAGTSAQCDPSVVSSGNWIIHKDCGPGVMVFELAAGEVYRTVKTTSTDATPVTNQSFSVYENAENGTVVGTILNKGLSIFSADDSRHMGEMFILNALPGTPFAVSTAGEITVRNTDAIDYENMTSFTLEVQTDHVNRPSQNINVTINVANNNDVAPMQVTALANVAAEVGSKVSLNIAAAFTDIEGDGVSFTSTELPSGLLISLSGDITGTPASAGDFSSAIIVTDGMNTTTTQQTFTIAKSSSATAPAPVSEIDEESNSSGGSFGLFIVFLAGLSFARRRVTK
ncbi:S8 family serine peptidase [Colwelliaceae bacterium BS250]